MDYGVVRRRPQDLRLIPPDHVFSRNVAIDVSIHPNSTVGFVISDPQAEIEFPATPS